MCSLTIQSCSNIDECSETLAVHYIGCVLLLQNVFSYDSMCSLTIQSCSNIDECFEALIECVLLLQNVFSYYRMCSLIIECVPLLQNVFSYYRMCSLSNTDECSEALALHYIECVLLLQNVFAVQGVSKGVGGECRVQRRMQGVGESVGCRVQDVRAQTLTTQCILLRQNVVPYDRMCSLRIERVLLLQNVFSYYRMCFLTIECVLLRYILTIERGILHKMIECALLSSNPAKTLTTQQIVFSYYRMCSLIIECVLLLSCQDTYYTTDCVFLQTHLLHNRLCFLTIECVFLRQNVVFYDRMCSLGQDCSKNHQQQQKFLPCK